MSDHFPVAPIIRTSQTFQAAKLSTCSASPVREGKPIGTDPGLTLSFERSGDLSLIRIGSVERYEIPDALIFGG